MRLECEQTDRQFLGDILDVRIADITWLSTLVYECLAVYTNMQRIVQMYQFYVFIDNTYSLSVRSFKYFYVY